MCAAKVMASAAAVSRCGTTATTFTQDAQTAELKARRGLGQIIVTAKRCKEKLRKALSTLRFISAEISSNQAFAQTATVNLRPARHRSVLKKAMLRLLASVVALAIVPLWVLPAEAGKGPPTPGQVPEWVTLGTMGGPVPFAGRSQPANALLWADEVWLIDCGDGAMEQLAKAGQSLRAAKVLFISHLHFDHTGGIAALIGLRYQTNAPGKLLIYGPPGTRAMVGGIIASMKPAAEAGYGLPGEPMVDPADTVIVHELTAEEAVTINGVTIRAVQNSHYTFLPGSAQDLASKSYSYRFDLPGRSIVYTGDTGPSAAVERLGMGADMLISELIDVDATVSTVQRMAPEQTRPQLDAMRRHLTEHHLSPEQVGDMAARMRVKRVVVTHLAGPTGMSVITSGYAQTIASRSGVPVSIATDLDRY